MKKFYNFGALSAPSCMLFAFKKFCFLCDEVQFSVVVTRSSFLWSFLDFKVSVYSRAVIFHTVVFS